jgi:hypothetical protein
VRRTERLRSALERRVAALLAALFLAIAALPAMAAGPTAAVERGFEAYKSALAKRDGARAASAVSENSLVYYDRMRKLALSAPRSEMEELEGTERMLVLGLRHQAPHALLVSGKPEDLVAYAVNAGLVSETGVAKTELGEVTIQGDLARGWIVVDGKPTHGVLQFALEDGEWKFDLEFAMQSSAGLIAALARQSGMSEDDVIIELLSRGSGKPVGPEIWKPLDARSGNH